MATGLWGYAEKMEAAENRRIRRLQFLSLIHEVDERNWPTLDEMPETDVSDLMRDAAREIEE